MIPENERKFLRPSGLQHFQGKERKVSFEITGSEEILSTIINSELRETNVCGNNAEMRITPNPAAGKFSIVGLVGFDFHIELEIFSFSGEKILSEVVGNSTIPSADVSHLMEGFYIVRLSKRTGEVIFRSELSILR